MGSDYSVLYGRIVIKRLCPYQLHIEAMRGSGREVYTEQTDVSAQHAAIFVPRRRAHFIGDWLTQWRRGSLLLKNTEFEVITAVTMKIYLLRCATCSKLFLLPAYWLTYSTVKMETTYISPKRLRAFTALYNFTPRTTELFSMIDVYRCFGVMCWNHLQHRWVQRKWKNVVRIRRNYGRDWSP
jgi:hypothetical protein